MPKHVSLAIIGSGPAGISAAITAAYENIDTLVIEKNQLGGRIACSSMIQNMMGFPKISGEQLMKRSIDQARKMKVHFWEGIDCFNIFSDKHGIQIGTDAGVVRAQAVLLALGLSYNRLTIPGESNIVYLPTMEQQRNCRSSSSVVIVGGGNSAGQCALFLATQNKRVHLLVRGDNLSTMSGYLRDQIMDSNTISVHYNEEVKEVLVDAVITTKNILLASDIFVFTGTCAKTDWLPDTISRNQDGFLLTNTRMMTSVSGVFAAGDAVYGSVGRVAVAAGAGAASIKHIKDYIDARSNH